MKFHSHIFKGTRICKNLCVTIAEIYSVSEEIRIRLPAKN
jgi:hypothetical protein